MRKASFTAVIQKRPKGYIGWVEELPGTNTQGKTKREVLSNLKEAVILVLGSHKNIADSKGRFVYRHALSVTLPA